MTIRISRSNPFLALAGASVILLACLDATSAIVPTRDAVYVTIAKDSVYRPGSYVSSVRNLQIWPVDLLDASRDTQGLLVLRGRRRGFGVISINGKSPLVWFAVTGANRSDPVLIGHHGVSGLAPENTLDGVLAACDRRMPGVEVDLRYTKDSIPVLIHDEDVQRTSNGTGRVDQMTLAQLRQLDFGGWFGAQFAGARIPTLDEFFDVARSCSFDVVMLDVKGFFPVSLDSAFTRIGRSAAAAGLLSKLYVYYSDPRALARAKTLLPQIHTVLGGVGADSALVAEATTRRFEFVGLTGDGFQQTQAGVARLDSAGIRIVLYGLRYPLEPNDLQPFPAMIVTDWGWAPPSH